jgi:hypothetical protein
VLQHRPPALITNPVGKGADPMPDPRQVDPDRLRVVLDHGEVVELDGGTLVLDGQESPSVVLRLVPWRALACPVGRPGAARVDISVPDLPPHAPVAPRVEELELARVLELP